MRARTSCFPHTTTFRAVMTAIAASDALTGLRMPFVVERVTIPPSDLDPSLKLRVMVHHSGRKPGARPLLLLHGHPQSSIIWRDVAPALVDDGWHVVAMDLRGHGGSDAPPVRTRDGKDEPPAEEGKWRYSSKCASPSLCVVLLSLSTQSVRWRATASRS